MDGFSALVCSAQAFQYACSVVKSLFELRNALKYGGGYLRDEQAGVNHLREIIIQLIPKDQKRLDPGFESHLESISTAVSSLLRLLQQQRRLQVAILLVIRRAEVHDSFALLERKKTTLNLYLTAQNTAAIASLTTSALSGTTSFTIMSPHSHSSQDSTYDSAPSSSVQSRHYRPQDREIPSLPELLDPQPSSSVQSGHHLPQDKETLSLPERLNPQHSGSGLAPLSLDRQQSLRQQHEFSATGNISSRHGTQKIYHSKLGEFYKILHEDNISDGGAFQEIGQSSSGRKSKFSPKSVAKKMGGTFYTKGNQAKDGAEQRLFAPRDSNMIVEYSENFSDTSAVQNIGMDVSMELPRHKFPKKGIFRNRSSTT